MIDWSRIEELRHELGAEDFAEIVPLFLEETDEAANNLRNRAIDTAGLEEQLHFLKSSALNMGFSAFSVLCQQGESMAARGDGALVDLSALLHCYDASKAAFMQGLATEHAA